MTDANIRTYYSSRTESLIEALLFQLKNDETSPINDPFAQLSILVPNSGMQRYVELKIAERFGVCAHIHIGYVGQLVSGVYRSVLNGEGGLHLDERLLTFAILKLWQRKRMPLDNDFMALFQRYQQPRQRYVLAAHIASLLRQYSIQRPQMIDAWQAGKRHTQHPHESWQCDIFHQLMQMLGMTRMPRSQHYQHFVEALSPERAHSPGLDMAGLQSPIHVFGFHALPMTQLYDLYAISQATPVFFYTFNPCVHYWLDIVPEKLKNAVAITREDEAELMTVGHPLLASWGQSGKYYIEELNDYYAPNLDEVDVDDKPNSLLRWLQYDIRNMQVHAHDTSAADCLCKEKGIVLPSISVHAHANSRREVEVLHDHLCRQFDAGTLMPSEVIVMVPQLREYAPHIQAVFARQQNRDGSFAASVPYSLANQSSAETDADVQAFIALVTTIEVQFQAQHVIELLHEARIQEALAISEDDVRVIRNWLARSRYAQTFFDSSDGVHGSLEKLLDGLMLSAVAGDESALGKRVANQHFYDGQDDALRVLCEFWQRSMPFARMSQQSLTLSQWRDSFRGLCAAFLPEGHAMDAWITKWFDCIESIDDTTEYAFAVAKADIVAILQSEALHGPFLSGGVSFCAVLPMRSIPAKCIAVLGLNNDFPTLIAKDPLDVCASHPQWSDRHPHREQKYFFLEALMAAREQLYLSHVGIDEKTGELIPASGLVNELLAYLERQYEGVSTHLMFSYPLQGFAGSASYQALYATPAADEQSQHLMKVPNDAPVALPEVLQVNQLVDILLDPFEAFCRYGLHATSLQQLIEPLPIYDFVACENPLDTWRYRSALIHAETNNAVDDKQAALRTLLMQDNIHAPDVIADALTETAAHAVAPLVAAIAPLLHDYTHREQVASIHTHCMGQSIVLQAHVHTYATSTGAHLAEYHLGKRDAKKTLRTWISHLIYYGQDETDYNVAENSCLITLEKDQVARTSVIVPQSRAEAVQHLQAVLEYAHALIQQPYALNLILKGRGANTLLELQPQVPDLYRAGVALEEGATDEIVAVWEQLSDVINQYIVTE